MYREGTLDFLYLFCEEGGVGPEGAMNGSGAEKGQYALPMYVFHGEIGGRERGRGDVRGGCVLPT